MRFYMFVVMFIVQFVTVPALAETAGYGGVFSEGYRAGFINKLSVKGFAIKSMEGELMLGVDSVMLSVTDKDGNEKYINPWLFSGNSENFNNLRELANTHVWIHYNQARIGSMSYDTDYMFQDAAPVSNVAIDKCVSTSASGAKSSGFRNGYLVKASVKGNITKTYEIQIQEGNAGNRFTNMSILDENIYNCAVEFLKSGVPVTINYKQSLVYNPLSRDTDYDVLSIEASK